MEIEKSPFLSLDKATVIAFLKSTASHDPDIRSTQKRNLESAAKCPQLAGVYMIVGGVLLTLPILTAVIGIPLIGLGWWTRRRGVRNLKAVDEGYAEYIGKAA